MKARLRILGAGALLLGATLLGAPTVSQASAPRHYTCAKFKYAFVLPAGMVSPGQHSSDACGSDGTTPAFVSSDGTTIFGEALVSKSARNMEQAALTAFFSQMKAAGPAYKSGWVTINGVRFFSGSGIVANPNGPGKVYLHAIDAVHGGRLYLFVGIVRLTGKHLILSDTPLLKAAFQSIRLS